MEAALAKRETLARMSSNVPPLPHVITSAVEHPCVLNICKHLQKIGFCSLSIVPVDNKCCVSVQDIMSAVVSETCLITIMHANNEIGTVQPISKISQALKEAFPSNMRPIFHTDASQSLGKIPVGVEDLGVDLLTIAAHKFYAPKGIGALYMTHNLSERLGIDLPNFFYGGGQEKGRRPGTENVALIAGIGAGAELVTRKHLCAASSARYERLTRSLLHQLRSRCVGTVRMNGPINNIGGDLKAPGTCNDFEWARLPNTLSVAFAGIPAFELMQQIKGRLACSASAACHSHSSREVISQVLVEMGISYDYARGTLRLSVGKYTTESEIITASRILSDAANRLWETATTPSPRTKVQNFRLNKRSPNIAWNSPREAKDEVHPSPVRENVQRDVMPRQSVEKSMEEPIEPKNSPAVPRYMRQTRSSFYRSSNVSKSGENASTYSRPRRKTRQSHSKKPLIPRLNESMAYPSTPMVVDALGVNEPPDNFGTPSFRLSLRTDIDNAVEQSMTEEMSSPLEDSTKRNYSADGFGSEDWKSDFDRVLARTRAALLQSQNSKSTFSKE